MALTPGTRVGPYEIVSPIGAGGMGEVYRARDSRLNRDVAIKVLPDLFATDAERVARFTREAQTLAALNHPNIATIHGLEGTALVMELVDGDDLSERVAAGPLSVSAAVAIARQIIDALEAAHDAGIVHRDLKPANIKIRDDGTVKVLDFGLAKALAPDAGATADAQNSPTLTARATQMGMILGTAAYMSPEQARGRAVDKRTDVWAFGCVLYEMLTGAKAFNGEDATEIISAVMKSEPDVKALPAAVPAQIRAIVVQCLAKDRKARIPDVSVVRYMLDGMTAGQSPHAVEQSAAPQRRIAWLWPAATAVLMLTTLAVGYAWYRARDVEPAGTTFIIQPPDGTGFTGGNLSGVTVPSVSPDGRQVAFTAQDTSGKRMLYVRPIDSLVAQVLPGTEGAAYPFWSPDSRMIGYAITGRLLKVAVAGGPPSTVCALGTGITSRGGSWNRDGVIIFNNGPAPLYRAAATGGTEAVVMGKFEEGQNGRQFPSFLPDGQHYLFHSAGAESVAGIYVGSLDSDKVTRIAPADSGAVYDAASARVIFVRQGTLLAQAFNARTLTLSGDPIPIAEKVEAAAVPGMVAFSISETGVLAYGIGQAVDAGLRLTWLSREGKVLGTVGPPASYRGVTLSPDGLRAAVHRHDSDGGDVWLIDLSRNAPSRFTFDPAQDNSSPVWSPAGDQIAFQSIRGGKAGIDIRPANGAGADARVFETTASRTAVPTSWSVSGSLVFDMNEAGPGRGVWALPFSSPDKAAPRIQAAASESSGQFSRDGRWLAYQSNESGPPEIYVQPATGSTAKQVISVGGGSGPRWRGDGRELYYGAGGKMWAVELTVNGDVLVPGVPKALFDYRPLSGVVHPGGFTSYDVTIDGKRFLVARRETDNAADAPPGPLVVMTNWRKALRK